MKKLLALLLSIVMVLSLFAFVGCSKDKDPEKEDETETTSAPEEKEKEDAEESGNKTFLNYVGEYVDLIKTIYETGYSTDLDMIIKVSPEIISLLSEMAEIDLNWIKNICINGSMNYTDNVQEMVLKIGLNDTELLGFEYIFDLLSSQSIYMKIPDLSKSYINIEVGDPEGDLAAFSALAFYKALPDGKTVEKIIEKYVEIINNQINETKKEEAIVTVDNVPEKCVMHSFVFDNEIRNNITKAIFTEVQKDQDIKNIIKKYAEACGEDADEALDEFEEYIEDILEHIEVREENSTDEGKESTTLIALYLTESSEFVGIELTNEDEKITILAPSKQNKSALEITLKLEDLDLEISGSVQNDNGKANGEYSLKIMDKEVGNLKVTDFILDAKSFDETTSSGTIEFTTANEFWDPLVSAWKSTDVPSDVIELIEKGITVKYSIDNNNEKGKITLCLISDNEELFTLSSNTTTNISDKEITVPKKYHDINSEKDMEEYYENMNIVKFTLSLINKLIKAGIPEEFLSELMG